MSDELKSKTKTIELCDCDGIKKKLELKLLPLPAGAKEIWHIDVSILKIIEKKEDGKLYCILCKQSVHALEDRANRHYQSCWKCGVLTCIELVMKCTNCDFYYPNCDFYFCKRNCWRIHKNLHCTSEKMSQQSQFTRFLVDALYKKGDALYKKSKKERQKKK